MRARESGRAPAPGSSRPHLQQREALPPWPGLGQPAGLVSFRVLPRVTRFCRHGAEYRDGRTGAFGCDGIPPEGKGSPAVGLGAPQAELCQHQGLGQAPPSPGNPQLLSSSPKLSKVSSATKLTCPWPDILPEAPRKISRAAKEKRNKVQNEVRTCVPCACPPGRVGESRRAVPWSSRSPPSYSWPRPSVPPHASCGGEKEAAICKLAPISEDPKGCIKLGSSPFSGVKSVVSVAFDFFLYSSLLLL